MRDEPEIYEAVFNKLAAEPTLEHALAAEQFYVKLNMIVQHLPKATPTAKEIAGFQPSDPKQVARMDAYINDSAKMKEALALFIQEDNVEAIRWLDRSFKGKIDWDEMLELDEEEGSPLYIGMQNDSQKAFDELVQLGAKKVVKPNMKGGDIHYSLLGYQLYRDSVLSCTGLLGLKAPERVQREDGSIDGQKSLEQSVISLIHAAGVGKAAKHQKYVVQLLSQNPPSISIRFPPRYGERFAVFLMENGLAEKEDWKERTNTLTISPKNIERFLELCQFPLKELQQTFSSIAVSAVEPGIKTHSLSKLGIIQAALPKENGYPTINFFYALDVLAQQSLKPTLLLIDEVGEDRNALDKQITNNQLDLIKKVQELGGQFIVCVRPGQTEIKPELKQVLDRIPHDSYVIVKLNKLENPELRTKIQDADFVVVSGFDTNECVRATIGAKRDDRRSGLATGGGLMQYNIPVLYSDDCSRGDMAHNVWEGSRFASSLFFWSRQDSVYRMTDQAVQKYRDESRNSVVPSDFESNFNPEKLENIRDYMCNVNDLTVHDIKEMFRTYKIAPNNPLLDQITRTL